MVVEKHISVFLLTREVQGTAHQLGTRDMYLKVNATQQTAQFPRFDSKRYTWHTYIKTGGTQGEAMDVQDERD